MRGCTPRITPSSTNSTAVLEARMDRVGRAEAPDPIAVAMFFASPAHGVLPRMTAGPPRMRVLKHLRVAPGHADDGNPPSHHTASLRV